MLLAQKNEKKPQTASAPSDPPTAAGFGRVLNSIQGLQERLEDFSLDEISAAAETAKTLTLRLSEIQQKLSVAAQIRQSIAAAEKNSKQESASTLELLKLQLPDKSLPLRDIVQASKLIRFPSIVKIIKETANPPVSTGRDAVQTAPSQRKRTAVTTEETSVVQLPFIASEATAAGPATPIAETSESDLSLPSHSTESAPEIERKSPSPTELSSEPPAQADVRHAQEKSAVGESTDSIPHSLDFDQRLLDDLIKNYGEFAASPNLPATFKPNKHPKSEPKISAEKTPAPQPPVKHNVPSVRQGELDRQLKKLIKDYGEYDLYSHRSSSKLRNGVIAAFFVLGSLFTGFYFFSGPRNKPVPAEAVAVKPSSEPADLPPSVTGGTFERHRGKAAAGTGVSSKASQSSARNKLSPKQKK